MGKRRLQMFTGRGNRGAMQMGTDRLTVMFVGMVTMSMRVFVVSMSVMQLMLMRMSVTMRVTLWR
jgi:hypothetical protein